MKKVIPFNKEIVFKTTIFEITDIEVTHELDIGSENMIEGHFLVNGKYKMSSSSTFEESFQEQLPFVIEVDEKYDLKEAKVRINDFYFEIVNEDILKINIELELSDISEKVELEEEEELLERCYEEEEEKVEMLESDEMLEDEMLPELKEEVVEVEKTFPEVIEPIDIVDSAKSEMVSVNKKEQGITNKSISTMFPGVSEEEDTFKSYYIYIVRENDTIDEILNKYQTTREEVSEYNNLEDVKIGSKLIIPSSHMKDE